MTDSGRMSNRMWYFFASNARPDPAAAGKEEGLELVLVPRQRWNETLRPPVFRHALQMAGLFLAESAGRLTLPC
jgi:hypothetical protein